MSAAPGGVGADAPGLTVLSWNIQVFGKKKGFDSRNNLQVQNVIGALVAGAGVDVLCVQEIMTGQGATTARELAAELVRVVNGWTRPRTYTAWVIPARPSGDRESLLYLTCDQTTTVADRPAGVARVAPWWTTRAGMQNPAFDLTERRFPSNGDLTHGRRPAWLLLQTSVNPRPVVVLNYHAPPNAPAAAAAIRTVFLPALLPELAQAPCRVLCGDWNLDISTYGNFDPLMAATGTVAATTDRTHLYAYDGTHDPLPVPPPQTTQGFRNTNYDNIFFTAPQPAGEVIDLLDSVLRGRGRLNMRELAGGLILRGFPKASLIAEPINSPWKAWILTRYALSDHLPVLARVPL